MFNALFSYKQDIDILRDMELQKRQEIRFPENLHGLFTAQFSKTGEFIATGFGNGAIQVIYNIYIYI